MRIWRALYEKIYSAAVGFALKLRYRIEVEGEESVTLNPRFGSLFLANHVAEIDPVILEYVLWPRFHTRPLAVDYLFRNAFVRWFLHSVHSIPVPSVVPGKDPKQTVQRLQKFYHEVVKGLRKGHNFLLYPSGKLSRNGKEEIINQHSTHVLLHEAGECNVCLVHIAGLWGSSFSRYKTGKTPQLSVVFKDALVALLRRGIFFMPKRTVKVSICQIDYSLVSQFASKQELNTFLMSWFNERQDDLPVEVPYA